MGVYERILVPTDGSESVERAVSHALDLAVAHDARLHAIHVVDTTAFAALPMESSWESVDELLREDASEAVARVRELASDASVPVETAVVEGRPSAEIVAYAQREECDLVVMGTHGRGGLDRLLLGSVAESVVRKSPIPVTTVRVEE